VRARLFLPLLAILAVSCASAPDVGAPSGHADSGARVVDLSASTEGFEPELPVDAAAVPVTRIPTGSTLFFRNPDPSRFVILRLAGDFRGCGGCATVTGFACLQDGATSQAIQPGGIVSLCFHEPGKFPLEVRGGATPFGGLVEVFQR
jgi:hypothetical protein